MKKIAVIEGEHDYDLSDDFTDEKLRVTQTKYYRPAKNPKFVIAIAELNRPNRWDDAEFSCLCEHLEQAWNNFSPTPTTGDKDDEVATTKR